MSTTVEFLFDVGSPYTYLAYHHLPKMAQAHGAQIVWTPVLLGGIFQATGNASPAEVPAKSLYSQTDLQRWARSYGVPFRMNPHFPINTLALMRGAVAAQRQGDEVLQRYLAAIFGAMFEQPRNLGEPAVVGEVLAAAGFDPAQFLQWIAEPAVKDRLKENTVRAVERGVFGAPTFFVGRQMFWGQDRLAFVDQALAAAEAA
ncbi:2-hydroxychromene-2-carboxylate isomerase [Comamonas granuli]|uniref:2-hydroxychromene-2-carboxylate isomerase n=1 Tax=Comamonas granuli TaxID=290309 RepID=UPI0005A68E38|nr:2-hydroxychromene-2-carboxylate isomerase [Comamonas granuli]